jgi:hypothetical protein
MKKINFWWDMESLNHDKKPDVVIIESNDKKYPLVAIFNIEGYYADKEIAQAEEIIEKLNTGMLNYKTMASHISPEIVKKIFPNNPNFK